MLRAMVSITPARSRRSTRLRTVGRAALLGAAVAAVSGSALSSPASAATTPRPTFAMSIHASGTVAQLVPQFQQLKDMGVTGIRADFSWTAIEPEGHDDSGATYRWTRQDDLVTAAEQVGLQVDAILDYSHPLYNGGQGTDVPPTDPHDFADFAADVATHFGTRLHAIEVWNEENSGRRFWMPAADPAGYADLLCATYAAVKPVVPTVPVVFGGVFMPPVGNVKSIVMGGATFVDQALTAMGDSTCFDALGYHPYTYPFTAPEISVAAQGGQSANSDATQLRQILAAHGLGSTPIWNTESGWPTNPTANGVTEAMQARYTARLALLSWQADVPWVTFYDQYDDADADATTNQESHFGFWHYDAAPEHATAKPVVSAMTNLTTLLGPDWTYTADVSAKLGLPAGSDAVPGLDKGYALEFTGPDNQHTLALWYVNESYSTTCSAGVAAFNCPVMPYLPEAATIKVQRPVALQTPTVTRTTLYGAQDHLPRVDTMATAKARTALKDATRKVAKARAALKKAHTKAEKARAKRALARARKAESKARARLKAAVAAETRAKTVRVGQDPIFLSWTGRAL